MCPNVELSVRSVELSCRSVELAEVIADPEGNEFCLLKPA
jgi:hypothetical protein